MSDRSPADAAREKFIDSKIPANLRGNYDHDISMIRGGWHAALDYVKKNTPKWRRQPADESGLWWYWNEDEDAAPIPIEIMMSGGEPPVYFAAAGQYGWTWAQPVKDMGGLWMRCIEPFIPTLDERDQLREQE